MKINQIRAGVLLSYVQIALNLLVSLVYTPVMLRLLGQSEYGIYTLASSTIAYLGLLNFGLSSSYVRYFTRYRENGDEQSVAQLNAVFLLVYAVIAAVALCAGLVLAWNVPALFGEKLTAAETHTTTVLMVILSLNLMMTFLTTVFAAYVSANERFVFQKLLNICKIFVAPMVSLPLLFLGYRSLGLTIATTAVSVLVDFLNIWYCFRRLRIRFRLRGADFHLVGEIASYSVFIAINSVVDQINWQVDKFILGRYWGALTTAVYGVAAQVNAMYVSVSSAISSVFVPRVHRISHMPDRQRHYTDLMIRLGRIQFLVLGLVASGLILAGKPFLRMWAGAAYEEAYPILLLLVLPGTVPLIQNIGIEIQRAENQHRFRSLAYLIMALFNVAVSIPLGRRWGGVGCAFGTGLSLLLSNGLIMNWYYARRMHLGIARFWRELLSVLPAVFLACLLGWLWLRWIPIRGVMTLAVFAAGFTALYSALVWFLSMKSDEKQLVTQMIRKVRRRARS